MSRMSDWMSCTNFNKTNQRQYVTRRKVVDPAATNLRRVLIDNYDFVYSATGTGELVILVHGALGDYRTWSRQLDTLSEHYHVVSYSRRAHHPQDFKHAKSEYSYRTHANDLIALIEALSNGPAHVVGHSYGGAIAALAAIERPDLFRTIVLAEPSLFFLISEPNDKIALQFHRIALNVVKKLAETGEMSLAVREYLKIVTGRDGFDELSLDDQGVINQNAQTLGPMLSTYFESVALDSYRSWPSDKPTLILTGEHSPIVYRATCKQLRNNLPNSKLLVLPETSHGLHMESPNLFDQALMEFLSP